MSFIGIHCFLKMANPVKDIQIGVVIPNLFENVVFAVLFNY